MKLQLFQVILTVDLSIVSDMQVDILGYRARYNPWSGN
jgi:hypothetical protein